MRNKIEIFYIWLRLELKILRLTAKLKFRKIYNVVLRKWIMNRYGEK